jgi:hypothetical protein
MGAKPTPGPAHKLRSPPRREVMRQTHPAVRRINPRSYSSTSEASSHSSSNPSLAAASSANFAFNSPNAS